MTPSVYLPPCQTKSCLYCRLRFYDCKSLSVIVYTIIICNISGCCGFPLSRPLKIVQYFGNGLIRSNQHFLLAPPNHRHHLACVPVSLDIFGGSCCWVDHYWQGKIYFSYQNHHQQPRFIPCRRTSLPLSFTRRRTTTLASSSDSSDIHFLANQSTLRWKMQSNEPLPPPKNDDNDIHNDVGSDGGGWTKVESAVSRTGMNPTTSMGNPRHFTTHYRPNKPSSTPIKRATYRPGFNSYLKVVFEEETMDRIYQLTQQLCLQVEQGMRHHSNSTNQTSSSSLSSWSLPSSQPQGRYNSSSSPKGWFQLKPKSRESLHMTLFFGGEVLCQLPPSELQEWYTRVRDRLLQTKVLYQASSSEVDDNDDECDDTTNKNDTTTTTTTTTAYWFRVIRLDVFPPQRRNLVVALFEASPAWHELHDDLRRLTQTSSSLLLSNITQVSKDRWTPHVTLASVVGGTKRDISNLSDWLQQHYSSSWTASTLTTSTSTKTTTTNVQPFPFMAKASGISMGGPVPSQVTLDWDFRMKC